MIFVDPFGVQEMKKREMKGDKKNNKTKNERCIK